MTDQNQSNPPWRKDTLSWALLGVQKKLEAAKKSSMNSHFKHKYANLTSIIDAVKGPLNDAGILILQPTGKDEHGVFVETQLVLAETGEKAVSRIYLADSAKADMQKLCGAITYARRYGAQTMLFLDAEDDDGETAVGRDSKATKKQEMAGKVIDMAGKAADFDALAGVTDRVEKLIAQLQDKDLAKASADYAIKNATDLEKLQKFETHLQKKVKEQKGSA